MPETLTFDNYRLAGIAAVNQFFTRSLACFVHAINVKWMLPELCYLMRTFGILKKSIWHPRMRSLRLANAT